MQKRYYDFNIRNHTQFVEKLQSSQTKLMCASRGLEWSSFLHRATGMDGRVKIDCPIKPKNGLKGRLILVNGNQNGVIS
jgi:hypothetical protein